MGMGKIGAYKSKKAHFSPRKPVVFTDKTYYGKTHQGERDGT